MLRPPDIRGLRGLLGHIEPQSTIRSIGHITKLVGLTVESFGPIASVGDLVAIQPQADPRGCSLAEVAGFRDNRLLLLPLEGTHGIRPGDRVLRTNRGFSVQVGEQLLGRILDGLGRPIDGRGPVVGTRPWAVHRQAPDSLSRRRIRERYHTGIRSIDTALPCGCGQRVGIFAGSGVGKSSLLGMLCRNGAADVNVVALIGERGKEVLDFTQDVLGEEGLTRSVLVVVTSDRPALQRVKGAETAMAIAEYFRHQGANCLLVMDSVTRYAMAQREIGLAVGEPPTTKGYPPSVFSMLARLLERAGTSDRGTITGFFTVLVEGDDLNDPIADTARSILDGHIVLSRRLANHGHYPPVDILESVSRVANEVTDGEHRQLAINLRELLSTYSKAEDMINLGAYSEGSNPAIDRAITAKPAVDALLRQSLREQPPWEETRRRLEEVAGR